MYKHLLSIFILLISISLASAESDLDSVSFATYYPAPYGNYREMRTMRMAIGDNYIRTNEYDWETGATNLIDSSTDLIVEGNVGVGTANPRDSLEVHGTSTNQISVSGNPLAGGGGVVTSREGHLVLNADSSIAGSSILFSRGSTNTIVELMRITQPGNVGIGTDTPSSKLTVAGGIQLGDDTSACTPTKAGTIRFNSNSLQYCKDSEWKILDKPPAPSTTCNDYAACQQNHCYPNGDGFCIGDIGGFCTSVQGQSCSDPTNWPANENITVTCCITK